MDTHQQLAELEQRYETHLNDITELRDKLELEESKLFQCQKEIRRIKGTLSCFTATYIKVHKNG